MVEEKVEEKVVKVEKVEKVAGEKVAEKLEE